MVTDINMVVTQADAVYLLLYYYYGGMIYTLLKNFDRALFFFEVKLMIYCHFIQDNMLTWLGLCDDPHGRRVSHHVGGLQEIPVGWSPRSWRRGQTKDFQGWSQNSGLIFT